MRWRGKLDEMGSSLSRLGVFSVELIGLVIAPTLLPLSIVAGVVTLAIGVTGNIEFPFKLVEGVKRM